MSSLKPTLLAAPTEAAGAAGATVVAPTDYKSLYATMKAPQLFSAWNMEKNPKARDALLLSLVKRQITEGMEAGYPSGLIADRERAAGLYPDTADPLFAARLFEKREFYEARAVAAGVAEGTVDPCSDAKAEKLFELTPVQRIVSRFMHPLTPYNGVLLFHGVGVGKTCSAVTIAEQFLEVAPTKQVIVLVPQALQDNFKKTVFDMSKLRWDEVEERWTARQCTGTSYLERLGLLSHRAENELLYRVEADRRTRYSVTGYQAFANWVERTLKTSVPAGLTDPEVRLAAENEVLRRIFSDRLIIVDEAHNLRDTAADADAAATEAVESEEEGGTGEGGATVDEAAENAGGKALNPYLRRIILNAEGLRLVLMTATPMYNSAPEIVLLLNYLIMNDRKTEKSNLKVSSLFDKHGNLTGPRAERVLAAAARAYVSYMRGENPYTFPLRMRPAAAAVEPAAEWPAISATRKDVDLEGVEDALNALPIVFTEPIPGSPVDTVMRASSARTMLAGGAAAGLVTEEDLAAAAGPSRDTMLDLRMQMGNITYPNQMYGGAGWDNYFGRIKVGYENRKIAVFAPRPQPEGAFDVDSVFAGEGLKACAPKIARIVESVRKARGICFVYSRYIKAGALPLALALERAGFRRRMASGKLAPLTSGMSAVAPICAICGEAHGSVADASSVVGASDKPSSVVVASDKLSHPFRQATYILLTSDDEVSPNFPGLVRQAANWPEDPEWGPLGSNVKVIIGSQVASEGLDLKCVREMHVMDAWYHLNRTDQIIGRAIRYCSHTALRDVEKREGQPPMTYNNCLIYLHAILGGEPLPYESADMYAYRIAIAKAQRVGIVQRQLKAHAWDCNLELEAITFVGLPKRKQVDSQGRTLDDYSIDDHDYTTYCDYQTCRHQCAVAVARTPAEGLRLNVGTYSVSDARRVLLAKQDAVRHLFDAQVIVPETVVKDLYSDLPWEIASEALMELLDGRRFRMTRPDGVEGFLIKRAGYLVFQPRAVSDTEIPMALRYAPAFQLRRHIMESPGPVISRRAQTEADVAASMYRSAATVRAETAAAAAAKKPVLVPAGGAGLSAIPEENAGASAAVVEETKVAAILPTMGALLGNWTEWVEFVAGGGEDDLPDHLAGFTATSVYRIWKWILPRFGEIPGVSEIAHRWWLDRFPSYPERRALLEAVLAHPNTEAGEEAMTDAMRALKSALKPDLFWSRPVIAYRVFNPMTTTKDAIEIWGRRTSSPPTEAFTILDTKVTALIGKQLGDKPIALPDGVGPLIGMIAPKDTRNIFKTLDVDVAVATKRTSGAECANVSNLTEHHRRVRVLQEAGRSVATLGPLLPPDEDAGWVEAGKKGRMDRLEIAHMKDITHQPLCIYMEFLTRLLDQMRVGGRRWFLSAVETSQSGLGLKGKK